MGWEVLQAGVAGLVVLCRRRRQVLQALLAAVAAAYAALPSAPTHLPCCTPCFLRSNVPAGSGYSSAVSQPANGGFGGSFTGLEHPGAAALRGSVGEALPPGVAPTPGAQHPHRLGEPAPNDPFASLAPGFRSALPVAPQAGSFKAGGAAPPPPTPAGGPPFAAPPPAANGNGAAFPAAGPFAGAPSPAAGLAPAAAAATATLFGTAPSLTGYDLSAPAAPKPQASGNPFA